MPTVLSFRLALRDLLFFISRGSFPETRLIGHAFPSPATDAPCRSVAPIWRNCHRTFIRSASHQDRPVHGEGAFKSSSRFRGLKFRRHAHARVSQLPRNKLSSALPRNDPAGSPIGGAAAQLIGCSCALSFACFRRARPHRLPFG